ncbi:MAG: phosphoribosylamine--glycine ligase, partial [Acidimicrobiia bacterium]
MVRVLVIGSGGREHALAWALSRSSSVDEVVSAPGNPGTGGIGPRMAIDPTSPEAVVELADRLAPDLVVVGPEAPLVAGVVDALAARGHLAFGPSGAAAQLEGSKAWMKALLVDAGVPTARHAVFEAGQGEAAKAFLGSLSGLLVVKADGLAGGKGVTVTRSLAEAERALSACLSGEAFGAAGRRVVVEEGLVGPELSLLVLCDGTRAELLAPAQDFKRVGEQDAGANTGGMGAYSPVPAASEDVLAEVMERVVLPTLATLAERGIEYRGVLYAGLMLTDAGPRVLEYNVRFGDPECQALIPRLSSDLAAHLVEAASGSLETPVRWRTEQCVSVVLAAPGYPEAPKVGDPIVGLEEASRVPETQVFHAGTELAEGAVVTASGRVLAVSSLGPDLAGARARAYEAAAFLHWPG